MFFYLLLNTAIIIFTIFAPCAKTSLTRQRSATLQFKEYK